MLHRTQGIVLRTIPFGEADLIVKFLTLHYGIIDTFAKSPRRTKSRFGSSLEPLTNCQISFWGKEDINLPRLTQADIIEANQELRETLRVFSSASKMVDFTLRLLPEGLPNEKAYTLLRDSLRMARENPSISEFISLVYLVKVIDISGYGPSLRCARCGRQANGFYTSEGSVICGGCTKQGQSLKEKAIPLSAGTIRLYETLRSWQLEKISRIKPPLVFIKEIERLLTTHIEYRGG